MVTGTRQRLAGSKRRTPVGAPPGTLVADQAAYATTMRLTVIAEDKVSQTDEATIEDIRRAMETGSRVWVDITGLADIEMLGAVGALFAIDELALEDVVNTNQRPKVDGYGTHALAVIHMFDGTSTRSKEQFSILFDKKHVVTFQERPGDCLDPVRKRLAAPNTRIRKRGAAYLVYALLDTILDAYFPMLEHIGEQLEDIEDEITADPDPEDITNLHALKRELLVVKRALWPTREMLSALTREDSRLVPREVEPFLRDTYDHAVQLIDIVETYRELATSLYDLYLSGMSTRMNEVMKVLTIVATIFIPLSFMAGVWGMNFDPEVSPWNMPELGTHFGYPVALGSMLLVGLGLVAYFRWKRWM